MTYVSRYAKRRTEFIAAAKQLANNSKEPYYLFNYHGQLRIESQSFVQSEMGQRRYNKVQGDRFDPEIEIVQPRRR